MENVTKSRAAVGRIFQQALPATDVRGVAETYSHKYDNDAVDSRKADPASLVNSFYDLATDFYEYGWGQSFHFGPLGRHETREAAIVRHEHYVALRLGLKQGQRVLDMGCGIGGPMRNIARVSDATIVGLNINKHQIERARMYNAKYGLESLCELVEGDFTKMPFEKDTFDAAYNIEAACHAADRADVFKEAFRVLKPGALLAGFEWCLTDKYDATNAFHRQTKWGIEKGNALPELVHTSEILNALKRSGFDVVDSHDRTSMSDPATPWYSPLSANVSFRGFLHSTVGTTVTHGLVKTLEALGLSPKGTVVAHDVLRLAQTALVDGGRLEIFTPMFFFLARKPETKRGKTAGK